VAVASGQDLLDIEVQIKTLSVDLQELTRAFVPRTAQGRHPIPTSSSHPTA
jgi:hypothetical protein